MTAYTFVGKGSDPTNLDDPHNYDPVGLPGPNDTITGNGEDLHGSLSVLAWTGDDQIVLDSGALTATTVSANLLIEGGVLTAGTINLFNPSSVLAGAAIIADTINFRGNDLSVYGTLNAKDLSNDDSQNSFSSQLIIRDGGIATIAEGVDDLLATGGHIQIFRPRSFLNYAQVVTVIDGTLSVFFQATQTFLGAMIGGPSTPLQSAARIEVDGVGSELAFQNSVTVAENGALTASDGGVMTVGSLMVSGPSNGGEVDVRGGTLTISGNAGIGQQEHAFVEVISAPSGSSSSFAGLSSKFAVMGEIDLDGPDATLFVNGGLAEADAHSIVINSAMLVVSSGATVNVAANLTLLGDVEFEPDGTENAQGGIVFTGGGSLNVGVGASAGVGTSQDSTSESLQVSSKQLLSGHGLIDSDITGQIAIGDAANVPTYALTISGAGTIEADGGILVLHGNVVGDATAQIDDNATLELGGTFGSADNPDSSVVDFQDLSTGTLIIDDLPDFNGGLKGLDDGSDTQSATSSMAVTGVVSATGDKIVLKNTSVANGNAVISATIGHLATEPDGPLYLQIKESSSNSPQNITLTQKIPLIGLPDSAMVHDFFNVTQSGKDTVLTLTSGNPIALAVNSTKVPKAIIGAGVKVGVISDNFGDYASDQQLGALPSSVTVLKDGSGTHDEGRAMAEIIHDVAPGASIDFYTGLGDEQALADAITALKNAGCQVIVDDLQKGGEANTGSVVENAIHAAVAAGVTYVTSAGNSQIQPTIYGHKVDPLAETVAAINWLASKNPPASVGGYLPTHSEPYSSLGPAGSHKPNVAAPDGGPTTLLLSGLNAFFGTSESSPTVAGIAALVLQANPQLQDDPLEVYRILNASAVPYGDPANQMGAGLIQANQAVGLAQSSYLPFLLKPKPLAELVAEDTTASGVSDPPIIIAAALSKFGGDANTGTTLKFSLTLDEAVTVVGGAPSLTLNDEATASYDSNTSDPGSGLLVFNYTVAANDHVTSLAVTDISSNGATVQDANGSNANFSLIFDAPTGVSINSPLVVTGLSASQTGEIQAGQTVQLTLTLNEAVAVNASGGDPSLILNNGAVASYDANASNSSAGKLVFDYTAGPDDGIPNLSGFQVDVPAGTTIQDATGNNADFSGQALLQNTGLQVGPSFVGSFFTSQTGTVHTAQTVQLNLVMSSAITVTGGTPTLSLNDGAAATYDAGASNPSTGLLVFDYTVASPDQASDLQVTQVNLNGSSIKDGIGVNVDTSGAVGASTGLSINSPLLTTALASSEAGQVLAGQLVQLTLTLNAAAQDYSVDNTNGPPTLVLNDGEIAFFDAAASNLPGNTLVFDYTAGAGETTSDLQVTDANLNDEFIADGNGNLPDFSGILNVSTHLQVGSALFVTSVTPSTTGEADAGAAVKLTLKMSESLSVTGGVMSLTLNDGAAAAFDAGASNLATGSLVFDYTVGTNDHAAVLQISSVNLNGATAKDGNGQLADFSEALNIGTGLQIGSSPLNVSAITALTDTGAAHVNASHLVAITLTTSVPATVTGTPTLQLSDGEVAAYTIGSGSSTLTFTYVVQPGDNAQDLHVTGLNLPNGASIEDGIGNPLSGPVGGDLGITVDTTTVVPTTVETEIMGLYAALYNRAGEAGGYTFWVSQVAAQTDAAGLTVANSSTTAVTAHDAQVLGQGFVISQSTFFNATYGGLSDSAFINAMYVNIGGNAGDPGGLQFWSGLLQSAENAGQSVQDARAGLVGQFVQILSGFDTNNRPAGLTDQQWTDAIHRTQTIDNKIATSIGYFLASQQTDGALLNPVVVNDPAYLAAIRAIQGVTSDGLTADQAISNIAHAIAAHDLNLIQPVGTTQDSLLA